MRALLSRSGGGRLAAASSAAQPGPLPLLTHPHPSTHNLPAAHSRSSISQSLLSSNVPLHRLPVRHCGLVAYVRDRHPAGERAIPETPIRLDRGAKAAAASSSGGLSGDAGNDSHAIDRSMLSRAASVLHHRGPDGSGVWLSDDGGIGLAHVRLSIIDPDGPYAKQPMKVEGKKIYGVVNGEIYDFEPLRASLSSPLGGGWRFLSRSDSEVALVAYAEHGPARMMDSMRGEFAICIWDEEQQVFYAIRDRFGIKPLYYARINDRWVFASEIKALFAMGFPARWDIHSIASGCQVWASGSCFAGVHVVPPAHMAIVTRNGDLQLRKYWEQQYPTYKGTDTNDETRTIAEMTDGVRKRILDAVRVRLRSDVPVGIYLSGGIDSCTALGVATHLSGTPLDAFSISFSEHSRFDEASTAQKQAELCKARFHRLNVSPQQLADELPASLYHCEQACPNVNGVAKFMLSKAVRDAGVKVVLTGEGSDEIFAGYAPFREDVGRYGGYGWSDDERNALLESLKHGQLWLGSQSTGGQERTLERSIGFAPSWARSLPPNIFDPFLSDEAQSLLGEKRDQIQYVLDHTFDPLQLHNMRHKWEPLHVAMFIENKTMLPAMLLTVLGDRNEMGHSVEARLPFLDHPLVDYVNMLPSKVKIRETREKWILRQAAKPFITEEVYNRIKHPFFAPPALLNKSSPLYELVQQTLRGEDLRRLWWVDARKVIAQLDSLEEEWRVHGQALSRSAAGESGTGTISTEDQERLLAKLLAADWRFMSLVSYVMLNKIFNVQ